MSASTPPPSQKPPPTSDADRNAPLRAAVRTLTALSLAAAVLACAALYYATREGSAPALLPVSDTPRATPAAEEPESPQVAATTEQDENTTPPRLDPTQVVTRSEWDRRRAEVDAFCSMVETALDGLLSVAPHGDQGDSEKAGEDAGADAPARDRVALASELVALMDALDGLRADFDRLEQRVQTETANALARLEEENAALRDEIRRLYAQGGEAATPIVPRPGREVLEELRRAEEPAPPAADDAEAPAEADATAEPPSGAEVVRYDVVSEWGRSPEVAAQLGDDVSSLAGMICVVAEDIPRDALIALGRHLRREFDAYDNIAIDVFDDRAAAEAASADTTAPNARRVLSVSRSRAAGRDLIMVYRDGSAEVVQPTAI